MQRLVVHRIGVGSLGRLIGTWFAIVGLFVGVVSAVVTTVAVFEDNDYSVLGGIGVAALITLGWVFVYPMIMFVLGWLQGALVAVVFNFVISGSGGLTMHVDETELDKTPAKK